MRKKLDAMKKANIPLKSGEFAWSISEDNKGVSKAMDKLKTRADKIT